MQQRLGFRNRKREEPENEIREMREKEEKCSRLVLGVSDYLIGFGWVGDLGWALVNIIVH